MRPTSKKHRVCFWLRFWLMASGLALLSPRVLVSQDYGSQNNRNWQPPQMAEFVVPKIESPGKSWPDEPLQQINEVRPANLEIAVASGGQASNESSLLVNLPNEAESTGSGLVDSAQQDGGWATRLRQKFAGADVQKMLGSLAVVLGGYFGFVWLWRRFSPGSVSGLPSEVLEIIGQTPFGPKKNLQLVRLGTKLLLLINGPEGTHPIGEVTDQAEVDHITTLCSGRGYRGQSEKNTMFKNLVQQLQQRGPTTAPSRGESPIYSPQVIASPLTHSAPAANPSSSGELEQILKTLTQAVRQTQHKNEFEA